jgi:selenide,water dikinase
VLVDASTLEDAGVFAHGRGEVLVQTVDFFPPIVDDPYDFGLHRAGELALRRLRHGWPPLTALALLCAPEATLPPEVLAAVMQGGTRHDAQAGDERRGRSHRARCRSSSSATR